MKIEEIRKKSVADLQKLTSELKDKVRELRFKVASQEVKNYELLKTTKKDIARILTVIKERENDGNK